MKNKEEKLKLATKVIDQWLEYKRYSDRIPSLSYSVMHKGEVLTSRAYGWSDLEKEVEAGADTCYRVASITKMFTALSILQLFEKGKLRLDDKLYEHIDWLDKQNGDFTIRQLLSHQTGVERDTDEAFWITDEVLTLKNLKKKVKSGACVYGPLEKFKYSNVGFALLGLIIENVSDVSYQEYIMENIIDPLSLDNTFMGLDEKAKEKLAVGYGREIKEGQPREAFPATESGALMPAAGLITNALDLGKFLNALFLNNKLLDEETLRLMKKKNIIKKAKKTYYGLGVKIWDQEEYEIIGHTGGFTGFITACGIDTENKVSIVVLTNGLDEPAFSLMKGAFSIVNYFLKEVSLKQKSKDLDIYEGIYTHRWAEMGIIAGGDKLFAYSIAKHQPFEDVAVLEKKKDHEFKITSGSGFDSIGEKVRFEVVHNKVKKLYYAKFPMTPFTIPDYKGSY